MFGFARRWRLVVVEEHYPELMATQAVDASAEPLGGTLVDSGTLEIVVRDTDEEREAVPLAPGVLVRVFPAPLPPLPSSLVHSGSAGRR
jgi:hypothetical protein